MDSFLSAIMNPGDLWPVVAFIAGALVLLCLKTVCEEMDHEIRWRRLRLEADALRQRQNKRIKELGLKSRR